MIEVKNLKKGFNDKTVINDVSVVMQAGKCNLIIGASGSGKNGFHEMPGRSLRTRQRRYPVRRTELHRHG